MHIDFEKIEQVLPKVSYNKQHADLSIDEWQLALRKQYALNNPFKVENLKTHPVFSDFKVSNLQTDNSYKVSIRSIDNSMNYCECFDFKTNNLGTCKHIEAALIKLKKSKSTAVHLGKKYTAFYSSIYINYVGERKVMLRIGKENEEELKQIAKKYFDYKMELLPEMFDRFDEMLFECKQANSEFRCYQDALDFVIEHREKHKRSKFINENYATGNGFDNLLKVKLFPYQKEGIIFAAAMGKALIADDMGLGKTIQAIGVAELLKKEFGIENVLIVCPTSLKYQWKSEIEKFSGTDTLVIEGNPLKRAAQYRENKFYKIASYHGLSNDIETINKVDFDLIILDEAQKIKNYNTKISKNVKKAKSTYTVALTGTPLENKLEDLYSILQFVNPFVLGPFYKFLYNHQQKNEFGKVIGYKDLNEIGVLLSNTMIRRKKTEVLKQLPERIDKTLFVPMTGEQFQLHEEYKEVVAKIMHKWKRMGFLNEKDRQRLMISLNIMRMVCDSTFILDQETRFDNKIEELMNILDEFLAQGNEKVVVFSQWERMTRLVSQELEKRNIGYEYLHGSIPSADREKLFINFNNDENCKVFLSTDAGGLGLNLQIASLLINLDIPWNPAVLEQRIARIYRLGQQKNVTIINMVSTGTIEHRMLDVLEFKSSLADGVLDKGEDVIFMGESNFKKFMNSMEEMLETNAMYIAPAGQDEIEDKKMEKIDLAESSTIIDDISQESEILIISNDDDDTMENETLNPVDNLHVSAAKNEIPELNLVELGTSFFGQLSKVLASKEETEKLVSQIVQTDEKDGKTYLKIPVESEAIVKNIFGLIASFMK
jgi:SNF2 family DNA or RNA helicase